MYVDENLRRALIVGGVAVLAVVGVFAVTHRPETARANAATTLAANPEPVALPEPLPADHNSVPVISADQPFDQRAVAPAPAAPAPMVARAMAPAPAPAMAVARPVTVAPVMYRRARVYPVYRRRYYARRVHYGPRRVVVVRRRPFRRSAEIVGGSAAGGALIGALAGGGKGAGIGAIAGGAGGLVYDRLTHKKRVVVRRY